MVVSCYGCAEINFGTTTAMYMLTETVRRIQSTQDGANQMANQQVAAGNWNEVKGEIMTKWGQLTDHDLTSFKGSVTELVGLIQQKTGYARDVIERELNEIIDSGSQLAKQAAASTREFAQHAGERVQEGYEYAAYQADEIYRNAETMIKNRPMESVAVVFGAGVAVGVLVGLMFRR
jgi:uncharacterized protein YjbJ (UPF0337 family)